MSSADSNQLGCLHTLHHRTLCSTYTAAAAAAESNTCGRSTPKPCDVPQAQANTMHNKPQVDLYQNWVAPSITPHLWVRRTASPYVCCPPDPTPSMQEVTHTPGFMLPCPGLAYHPRGHINQVAKAGSQGSEHLLTNTSPRGLQDRAGHTQGPCVLTTPLQAAP